MAEVAVLGLGAMGSRMAFNLIKAGHRLTVWNRTAAAAEPLVAAGARQASSPREAAAGAAFVLAMVRDNQASKQVWLDPEQGALAGMSPGGIAIESSTLTPEWVRELGQEMARRNVPLMEAPVSGSRPQAEAGKLIFLVGGEETVLAQAQPLLAVLGSAIHFIGPLGSGALTKLATNALLGIQLVTLAELIGVLKHAGADAERALKAVSETAVWSPADDRMASAMLTANFAPQFPIELIEKDFAYVLEAAGGESAAPTIAAARGVFQRAISQGLGGVNMTGVIKLFEH